MRGVDGSRHSRPSEWSSGADLERNQRIKIASSFLATQYRKWVMRAISSAGYACRWRTREQGNEGGKNCDHAHDGMAVALPPMRQSSRTRIPRWTAADQFALLHQWCGNEISCRLNPPSSKCHDEYEHNTKRVGAEVLADTLAGYAVTYVLWCRRCCGAPSRKWSGARQSPCVY